MARLSRNSISLAFCLFLLSGCSALSLFAPPPPPPAPSLPAVVPAAPYWEKLADRRSALENLKGLASVQARTGKGRVALDDVVVVVRRAQALRLEGIGPFGQPLFLFVTNGENLALFNIREDRLVLGRASRRNLERLFGIGVAPQALLRVLLGDIPLESLPTGGELAYRKTEWSYLWEGTQAGPHPKYRVWFDPQVRYPIGFEMEDESGAVVMQVLYGDFRPQGEHLLPARIEVVEPATQRRAAWQYTDIQLNTELSADLFRVRRLPETEVFMLREDPA